MMISPSKNSISSKICNTCQDKCYPSQKTFLCNCCNFWFHTSCDSDTYLGTIFRNKTYCKACFDINDIKKYNPFFEVLNQHDEILNSNFILENEPEESVEAIEKCVKYP